MIVGNTRPFMVMERNLRRGWFFAAFSGAICLYGIITDFAPLTGIGLGGTVISLMFVFILSFSIRPLRQTLDDMVTGNRYVHWIYSREFWEEHLRRERRRKGLEIKKYLLIGAIPGFLMALLLGGIQFWSDKKPITISLLYGFYGFCGMLGLFGIVGLFSDFYRWRRFRELRRLGGQVLLGPTGLYYSGDLYRARWSPRYLSVEWGENEGLSQLLFKFEVRVKNGTYIEEVVIPIPPGKEEEGRCAMQKVLQSW